MSLIRCSFRSTGHQSSPARARDTRPRQGPGRSAPITTMRLHLSHGDRQQRPQHTFYSNICSINYSCQGRQKNYSLSWFRPPAGRVVRQWGQPELCVGLHLTPMGTTRRGPCCGSAPGLWTARAAPYARYTKAPMVQGSLRKIWLTAGNGAPRFLVFDVRFWAGHASPSCCCCFI